VGPGRFGREVLRFSSPAERAAAWPALEAGIDYDPHSVWIGWAAEAGWPGLLGFAAAAAALLVALRRQAPRLDAALMQAAAIGLFVNAFHTDLTHAKFAWAAFGLALAPVVPGAAARSSEEGTVARGASS
jgi:hypothetical protein